MPKILGFSLAEHQERTRTALLQVLSELMSQCSFNKTTLSDVANHADTGCTAVYNHFADKEDLLLAFMEHRADRYVEELSRALTGTQDPIDRLHIYMHQQALITRHFHFPTLRPLPGTVSRGTASHLRAHGALMAQMLSSILTNAMDQELISAQEPEQVTPLIHATVVSGRLTPSDPRQRRTYLESLDALVLRTVGARQPAYAVPAIAQPRATESLEGAQTPGLLHHSAVG